MAVSTIKKPALSGLIGLINNIPYLANANADNYTTTGIYYFGSGSSNVNNYSIVFVLTPQSSNDIIQLAFDMSGYKMWKRRRSSSGTWDAWKSITFT